MLARSRTKLDFYVKLYGCQSSFLVIFNLEFIKETEDKIKNIIENELIYKQESFIQNEEVVDEDMDIDLSFIEHNDEKQNYNFE